MQAGVYRHYKGGFYQVLGVARHSETDERLVVYVSLTGAHLPGPRMNVRPEAMFNEQILVNDSFTTPRFEYMGDDMPHQQTTGAKRNGRVLIRDLGLSTRAQVCLDNARIQYLDQLIKMTESALLSRRNLGRTTLWEIKSMLATRGLSLSTGRTEQRK